MCEACLLAEKRMDLSRNLDLEGSAACIQPLHGTLGIIQDTSRTSRTKRTKKDKQQKGEGDGEGKESGREGKGGEGKGRERGKDRRGIFWTKPIA